jgi:hypothetical protein
MAAMVWSGFWVTRRLCAWEANREVCRDAVALGETPNLDRHVGVSYLNGMADFSTNWEWDRGFLSLSDGTLVFHAFESSFKLPLDLIQSVSIPWAAYIGRPAPVLLEWRHPDGTSEWIVFHVALDASKKATEK